MRALRTISRTIEHIFHWWLDYLYVAWWQSKAFLLTFKKTKYTGFLTDKPPVILLPGVYERWEFMKPLADVLHQQKYPVHVIEALGFNRSTIEEAAEHVERYIHRHKLQNVRIVAHSKGGLIGKLVMMHDDKDRIHSMVAINTPFNGSPYARLFPFTKTIRIFSPYSSIVKYLAENTSVNRQICSVYSSFDPHIPGGSKLKSAKNITLQSQGHFKVLSSPELHKTIIRLLDY